MPFINRSRGCQIRLLQRTKPLRLSILMVLAIVGSFRAARASSQEEWLPPAMAEGVAQQLAERLSRTDIGEADNEQLRQRARAMVQAQGEQLESWGEEGILDHAPSFSTLELPSADQRHLDAMVRYHLCSLILMRQFTNRELYPDLNFQITAVLGLNATTMAILYLRYPFTIGGGQDSEIEAFLTSDALDVVAQEIQTDPEQLEYAEGECGPTVVALLAWLESPSQ